MTKDINVVNKEVKMNNLMWKTVDTNKMNLAISHVIINGLEYSYVSIRMYGKCHWSFENVNIPLPADVFPEKWEECSSVEAGQELCEKHYNSIDKDKKSSYICLS